MKRLITLMMCAVSLGAAAQFPNLPYNPDENGDGFIGVVDLQGLLASYGSEFAEAVVSDDGESAILYMGPSGVLQCNYTCKNLPGFWTLPIPSDLVPILDDVGTGNVWLAVDWLKNQNSSFPYYNGLDQVILTTDNLDDGHNCYCTAKQLPRVEYSYCSGGAPDDITLNQCINEKLADGWYAFSGFPVSRDKQGSHFYGSNVGYEALTHASFWRWAE